MICLWQRCHTNKPLMYQYLCLSKTDAYKKRIFLTANVNSMAITTKTEARCAIVEHISYIPELMGHDEIIYQLIDLKGTCIHYGNCMQ